MSGHLHVALPKPADAPSGLIPAGLGASPCLPVWWPGRFAPRQGDAITVLASYERPAEDFWLADLPIADLPPDTFATWRDMYGLSLTPTFLAGQPCLLYGEYGKGGYLLSYSHLETPDSPEANLWLAHLLRELGGLSPSLDRLPPWPMHSGNALWEDDTLARLDARLHEVLLTGLKHGLLFERTDWLMGWRAGIPGANLNNLWASLRVIREKEPGNTALAYWNRCKDVLDRAVALFSEACIQYFLAERLSVTLVKFLPDAVPAELLRSQRQSLFGPPMQAGGLYREIMEPLDELAFLQLSEGK